MKAVFITEAYTEGGAFVEFAEDGSASIRWKAERFGSQFATPVAHEGYLYGVHGTGGTEMVCYEIESGKEMWRDSIDLEGARLGRASLHVDGAFLCIGAQGTLIWLDLSPKGARIISQTQLFRAPETGGSHSEKRPALRESKRYGIAIDLLRFERRVNDCDVAKRDGEAMVMYTSLVATQTGLKGVALVK